MSTRRILILALVLSLVLVVVSVAAIGAAPIPVYVSAEAPGTTSDGLDYGPEDIIVKAGPWQTFFDGSLYGFQSDKHEIDGFSLDEPWGWTYMTFNDNRTVVPGIPGKVFGQDIIAHDEWSPGDFYMVFDGSDVDLKDQGERLAAIFVIHAPGFGVSTDFGAVDPTNCPAGEILMSTVGRGKIFANNSGTGKQIRFSGEDILWFCAQNLGADTQGYFLKYFDGMADDPDALFMPNDPMPNRSLWAMTPGFSGPFGPNPFYFMTRGTFLSDLAAGGYNQLYRWNQGDGYFYNGFFNADDAGLNGKVTGLHIWPEAPLNVSVTTNAPRTR